MKGRTKKFLLWLAAAIVLLAALVALSPYWLGLVLPTVLTRAHIQFGSYERINFSNFKLRDVTYSVDGIHFHAAEVDGLTPLIWLWNKSQNPSRTYLNAFNWTLSFEKSTTNKPPQGISHSIVKAHDKLSTLREWVARAELHNGTIEANGEKIPIPIATWSDGKISTLLTVPRLNEVAKIDAQLQTFPWTLTAAIPQRDVRVDATITNATSIGGSVFWHTNRADFSATLSTNLLPDIATIETQNFRIATNDVDLRGYSDVSATLKAQWQHDQYSIDLKAHATPLSESTNLEPFSIVINASGDTNEATLNSLKLSSPGMQARLSAPLSVNFKGEMLNPKAKFVIDADLSKQPFLPVSGLVTGTASLRRQPGTYPEVTFDISGKRVVGFDIEAAEIKAHGTLKWPIADLQNLDAHFVNGTTAKIATAVDLEKRFIQHGTIQFSGKLGEDILPIGFDYEKLSLRADFHGPLKTLEHSGEMTLGEVVVPYLKTFRASGKWAGKGTALQNFSADLRFPNSAEMAVAGSADVERSGSTNRVRAKIDKLKLTSRQQTFALKTPTKLALDITKTNAHALWDADLSSVQLRSARGDLMCEARVQWPNVGRLSIYGHRLDSHVANDFLIRPIPEVYIEQISSSATWSNAPAKWNLDTLAEFVPATLARVKTNELHKAIQAPATVRVQAFGNDSGTTITNFAISQNQRAIASATGQLPLTISPTNAAGGVKDLFHLDAQKPIQFHLVTETNAAFWDAVMQGLPITIRNPAIQLAITGTLNEPRGTIRCEVPAGKLMLLKNAPPFSVANLKANVTLDRHQIHLLQLDTLIEGQPLSATATLPVPNDLERNWRKIFDWRSANAQVNANNVQIAPFAGYQPKFISPEGSVSANINIDRGRINGSVIVANAASRPIAQFGAIRDINAHLRFSDGRLDIEQCTGTLTGGPVSVAGWADLTRMAQTTNLPPFVVLVRGESVPLARRSDLIVRAKFNIIAANTNGNGPGTIFGNVQLQNSYVLSDLRLMVPPHAAKPQNRPPFFSIDTPPFNAWKLDLAVKGDRFMKIRSPFFNGVCSVDMHLGGTLENPLALGDAMINSGVAQFPFANVTINQGYVTLTTADPYMPHLFVTGSTKAYDFDIHMSVTGPVENPIIEFTSTPALTSEQILVMLTTGELPATSTSLTMQQRTLKMGAFVGKSLLSRFGIGAGEQRLTLESSRDATEQNTQTYSMEYKLNPTWSVIGDYNQFGGLNVGAKWRFYSK